MNERESVSVLIRTKYISLPDFNFTLPQHQVFTNDPLPYIVDLVNDGLEVARRIVRTGDEDFVRSCHRRSGYRGLRP